MHKLLKGILFFSAVLFATRSDAQEDLPPTRPLPPGMHFDTLSRRDADNWEFVQLLYPDDHKVAAEGSYHNGALQGGWIEYWENGMPRSITQYDNGKKNGLYLVLDMQGSINKMENYRNDLLEGPSRTYMMHVGIPAEETYYSKGVKHGKHTKWYPSRSVSEEDNYVNGTLEGTATWYYENGEKSVEYTYHNGKLNGSATTYFQNGRVSDMGMYKDNVQSGTWKEFYENGNLKGEGQYNEDGDKEGPWKVYDENGKYLKTVRYHNGEEKK